MALVVGMFAGMGAGFSLVGRLGRHLLHLGIVIVGAGTVVLALTVTGIPTASTLDLARGLLLIGAGAGISMGQLFDFILAGVGMDEVGSATGVVEAMQQLASAVGVAALGTIFFAVFAAHPPTHALAITAWACLARSPPRSRSSSAYRCAPASDTPDRPSQAGSGTRHGRAPQAPRAHIHTVSAPAAAPAAHALLSFDDEHWGQLESCFGLRGKRASRW